MKLSTVALITLLMITAGYVLRIGLAADAFLANPVAFVASSMGTWALMFFFFMLYLHSKED